MSEPWWKSAVVYQIYPRRLCDTDGTRVVALANDGRGEWHPYRGVLGAEQALVLP